MFWRLQELDLTNDLPVKDKQHIANHTEHEDLNTYNDKKHRKDRERDMLDVVQPLEYHKDAHKQAKNRCKKAHHAKIKHRVVHPRKPVDGADNLDAIVKW